MERKTKSPANSPLANIFQRLHPRLLSVGRRLLGNNDDASDAIQDTFVKLWSKSSNPDEAVVVTAVRNTCIDTLRQRKTSVELTDNDIPHEPLQAESDASQLFDDVNRVIENSLSRRDRDILLMRDRDGFGFDAIAARTGLTETAVRVALSRARRTVRDIYRNRQDQHKSHAE